MEYRVVGPESVYNLPLFEQYFLVDTRDSQAYLTSHIQYAVSCPPIDRFLRDNQRLQTVFQIFSDYEQEFGGPERCSPLIFYGETESDEFLLWLVNVIINLLQTSQLPEQFKRYQKCTKELWIIRGGFSSFQSIFPFSCTPLARDVPLPFYIFDRVFWGARSFELNETNLSAMRVTHLIVDKQTQESISLKIPITTLNVDSLDDNSELMFDKWKYCSEFIEQTINQHPEHIILVQFFGRSRSASIIIAWLMISRGYSLEAALNVILERFDSIDSSLLYLEQLEQLESKHNRSLPQKKTDSKQLTV